MKSVTIGKPSEYLAMFRLALFGYSVSLAAEGLHYDLLVDTSEKIVRVQVKGTAKARSSNARAKKYMQFNTCNTNSTAYSPNAYDVLCLVSLSDERALFYPQSKKKVIRVSPEEFTKENELATWEDAYGRL